MNKVMPITLETDDGHKLIFNRKVQSKMMPEWINNSFHESALATLKLNSNLYSWKAPNRRMMEDGLTKIKLILDNI